MLDRIARIALGWNDWKRAFIGDLLPDPGAGIGFVGNNSQRHTLPVNEGIEHLAVMNITAGNRQSERPAVLVYSCVNLTCAAAA